MIGDKMFHSNFLSYIINDDLPFKASNFNLWIRGLSVFSFYLKQFKNYYLYFEMAGVLGIY